MYVELVSVCQMTSMGSYNLSQKGILVEILHLKSTKLAKLVFSVCLKLLKVTLYLSKPAIYCVYWYKIANSCWNSTETLILTLMYHCVVSDLDSWWHILFFATKWDIHAAVFGKDAWIYWGWFLQNNIVWKRINQTFDESCQYKICECNRVSGH